MNIELVDCPEQSLMDFFEKRLEEFNVARWEIKEKRSVVVKLTDDTGTLLGEPQAEHLECGSF